MQTFGDFKKTGAKRIAGTCVASDDFKDLTNETVEMLMTRGSWWGTVQRIESCIYNSCVVWPREVETVLALNTCGHYVPLSNKWFRFVPIGPAGIQEYGFSWLGLKCCGNLRGGDFGTSPVFNNVACGKANYIRAYTSKSADYGKTITIFGIDSNGQVITTKDANGIWREGIVLTLAAPFVSTSMQVREITRVVKDETQGVVRLYQYDATNNVLLDCATYEPSEVTPEYRVTKIEGMGSNQNCSTSNCNGARTIQALVKLKYIPIEVDTDLVLIDCPMAMKIGMQAIRQQDSYSAEEFMKQTTLAVRELNLQLRNKFPVEHTSISIDPGLSAGMCRARVGRII